MYSLVRTSYTRSIQRSRLAWFPRRRNIPILVLYAILCSYPFSRPVAVPVTRNQVWFHTRCNPKSFRELLVTPYGAQLGRTHDHSYNLGHPGKFACPSILVTSRGQRPCAPQAGLCTPWGVRFKFTPKGFLENCDLSALHGSSHVAETRRLHMV